MSDRSTFDAFEQRLATEFDRYVAAATDPKSAAEIAAVAMRPRGLGARARNIPTRRRHLLLGLAATFLVPAALIGSGSIRPAPVPPDRTLPAPSGDGPRASAAPSAAARASTPLPQGAEAIFVRRSTAPDPGVSVFAVRPDGAEVLVRHVPDSIVLGGTVSEWGIVAGSGWLAMAVEEQGGPWPMVLVDLRDAAAPPWLVSDANTGAIGPRWGPTGLVAADSGALGGTLVIADPETRQTRKVTVQGLVGGGPSIIWTADGGIVSSGNRGYETIPVDGGAPRPGVGAVFETRGSWGDGLATLRICTADAECRGVADGRVERVETDASARTIWQPSGPDRALAAGFGPGDDYWLTVDHSSGRQVTIVHVSPGREDAVATLNREASWQYVGAPEPSSDGTLAVVWLDIGAKPAAVVVPQDGTPTTFHTGQFAGFVDRSVLPSSASATAVPGATLPPIGKPFPLPSLDQLIAAELALNPGERVLSKASHDGVEGDTIVRTTEVKTDIPGGQAYLDCRGPASATLTTGAGSTTSPCLNAGSYIIDAGSNHPITVTARGDTSWRVVVYAPAPPSPGDSAPPVSGP